MFTAQCPCDQNKREEASPAGGLSAAANCSLYPEGCKNTLPFQMVGSGWTEIGVWG